MKKYIEFKIRKSYVIMFLAAIVMICSAGGYYIWCSYHPDIHIQISDGGTGKDGIKIEAPHITYTRRGFADPAAAVELKIQDIVMKHEVLCQYVNTTYNASDIKLDMIVEDDQTVLNYHGKATTLNDEAVDFKQEIICDYVLDTDITHK